MRNSWRKPRFTWKTAVKMEIAVMHYYVKVRLCNQLTMCPITLNDVIVDHSVL